MTGLPQEQSGVVHDQSEVVHGRGEPAWNALTYIFKDAKATELEAYYAPNKRLVVKMAGVGKPSFYLYTTEQGTDRQRLNPKLTNEIRKALGESTLDKSAALQQERDSITQVMRAKVQTKQQLEEAAQNLQEDRQILSTLSTQISRLEADIQELEAKAGASDETAIQKLKDEKRELEAEHQRKKEEYDQARENAQKALQL